MIPIVQGLQYGHCWIIHLIRHYHPNLFQNYIKSRPMVCVNLQRIQRAEVLSLYSGVHLKSIFSVIFHCLDVIHIDSIIKLWGVCYLSCDLYLINLYFCFQVKDFNIQEVGITIQQFNLISWFSWWMIIFCIKCK